MLLFFISGGGVLNLLGLLQLSHLPSFAVPFVLCRHYYYLLLGLLARAILLLPVGFLLHAYLVTD